MKYYLSKFGVPSICSVIFLLLFSPTYYPPCNCAGIGCCSDKSLLFLIGLIGAVVLFFSIFAIMSYRNNKSVWILLGGILGIIAIAGVFGPTLIVTAPELVDSFWAYIFNVL